MQDWKSVPHQVGLFIKEGSTMFKRLRAAMKSLPKLQSEGGHVWFNPRTQVVYFTSSDSTPELTIKDWITTLKDVKGVKAVKHEPETPPNKQHGPWLKVKEAGVESILKPVAQLGGWKEGLPASLFGGPNPLSAMIASGALGAGAGYGLGALTEQFLPDKYFEKGKLRNTLGLAGGLVGAIPGFWAGTVNLRNNASFLDPIGSYNPPDATQKIGSVVLQSLNNILDSILQFDSIDKRVTEKLAQAAFPLDALENLVIYGQDRAQGATAGGGAAYVKSIEKDRFNRALWSDPFTPEPIKGMTSGVVEGASQLAQSDLISPLDIARIGIGMGSGYASGMLVGKALGALGGLNPKAQEALQQTGAWAGIIKGVAPLLFNQPKATGYNEYYG